MSNIENSDLFVIQRPAGSTAGTYKVTASDVKEYVGEGAATIEYKGARDFTDFDDDPINGTNTFTPTVGDLLINTATAPGNWVWTPIDPALTLPVEVQPGDRCIWNGGGYWELIPGGSGGGGVMEIEGTYPITIDDSVNGTSEEPIVEIEPAKLTDGTAVVTKTQLKPNGGAVQALATESDVASHAGASPNPKSVVTADLLKATNDEIAAITDPTTGYVSSVDKGTTGTGNSSLTITPTSGDVKVDIAAVSEANPNDLGVTSYGEIQAIADAQITAADLVESVSVGPNDGGATTISPSTGDVLVEVAAAADATPGVISINDIKGIIAGEGADGNLVLSVEEGDLTESDVFSVSALKIDPTAGEVKINIKKEVLLPYDFDSHLGLLPPNP